MEENKSKRDFGSFHASNVQELISIPEAQYSPPHIPLDLPRFEDLRDGRMEFGKWMREKHFMLEDCIFLNHGAFGAVLKEGLQAAQAWQRYIEKQPLRFYDRELLPHLVYVTRRMAKFVGSNPKDLVLVPNVTTAINCVIRSINLNKGDSVFCLSLAYGAVKKLVKYVCEQSGASYHEQHIDLPLKDKIQILDAVKQGVQPGMKLAVFDHIPSNTPFILPIKEISQICKEKNVPVLVDGAHALGSLPLNISDLNVDYYVTNCHKWFCSPKGAAIMYVHPDHQITTRPLIISHGFGSGFNSEFIWSGLRDYSAFLSLHTVLDFWSTLGLDKIRDYIYTLAKEAAQLLMKMWSSDLMAPEDMFGSMVAVRLPSAMYSACEDVTYSHAEQVQNALYNSYNIEVPIKAVQGHLYVRISAHVYNNLDEYRILGEAVLELTKQNILQT